MLSKGALLLVVVGAAVSLALLIESTADIPQQEQADSGVPVRLTIPIINVDAAIESVGLSSDGTMDVPKSPENTAWYERGPRPGENGSAVIAGHYGWLGGKPAAFDNLHTLKTGDKIYAEDDRGVTTTFVVRELRDYYPKADATNVFVSKDGKAHLNLITCEGAWDKTEQSYPNRLVVFADKE